MLAGILLLAGCVAPEPPHVSVQSDQFSREITLSGAHAQGDQGPIGAEWFIRSFVDKRTGSTESQLYIDFYYDGDWQYFDRAADDTASSLPVTGINRHVTECGTNSMFGAYCLLDETVGIALDEAVLRRRAATGYAVKISAHGGAAFVAALTPQMIVMQLDALDQTKTAAPAAR